MSKVEGMIPEGIYCHSEDMTYICPFWRQVSSRPKQQNGYCLYMHMGDWRKDIGVLLLWDQCKECEVNYNCWPEDEETEIPREHQR